MRKLMILAAVAALPLAACGADKSAETTESTDTVADVGIEAGTRLSAAEVAERDIATYQSRRVSPTEIDWTTIDSAEEAQFAAALVAGTTCPLLDYRAGKC